MVCAGSLPTKSSDMIAIMGTTETIDPPRMRKYRESSAARDIKAKHRTNLTISSNIVYLRMRLFKCLIVGPQIGFVNVRDNLYLKG